MLVTPQQAARWLDDPYFPLVHTRSGHRRKVDLFVQEMIHGKWKPGVGDPVEIMDGRVKEGVHRLSAVVQCGLTIDLPVLFLANTDNPAS